ncbi:MAG: DUF58 domain-containing protein [Candidatus Aureabacteria bacterium]|nr:DUF58 domain-containing protein [Candidatus Auribacterota bacterium]
MSAPGLTALFSSEFLQRLEALCIQSLKEFRTVRKGDRIARISGTSIEFADYRKYFPGDEIRHIDWNIYARTERLYLKTFKEDIDFSTHVLIDASRSMLFPVEDGKFDYARKLALALSYIGLSTHSSVKVAAFSDLETSGSLSNTSFINGTPFFTRRNGIFSIHDYLFGISPGGGTDFFGYLNRYTSLTRGHRGVFIILSDFLFEPSARRRGLNLLRYHNYDVKVIQVLGPREMDPFRGLSSAEVVDVETGERRVVSDTSALRREYAAALEEHIKDLRDFCRANRIRHTIALTDRDFETFVLRELPRIGIIK